MVRDEYCARTGVVSDKREQNAGRFGKRAMSPAVNRDVAHVQMSGQGFITGKLFLSSDMVKGLVD